MALSLRIPVLLAAAVAAAIAAAPAAAADPRPGGCEKSSGCSRPGPAQGPVAKSPAVKGPLSSDFSAGLPKGWTNEAQWARPGASNPFGSGPKPPVLALD